MAWNDDNEKRGNTCGKFWDQFDQLPVWKEENGQAVCRDARTGEILQTNSQDIKNRLGVDYFERFPVKLLCDIYVDEDEMIPAGTEISAEVIPSGQIYLLSPEGYATVIGHGEEGVNFEVI